VPDLLNTLAKEYKKTPSTLCEMLGMNWGNFAPKCRNSLFGNQVIMISQLSGRPCAEMLK